jgi:ferritin-like metal-binding protein YciE
MPGQVATRRSAVLANQLIQQVSLIYALETELALELEVLARRTRWLPLRLLLSDLRRETNRHVDRLDCLMPILDDRMAPPAHSAPNGKIDRGFLAPIPAAAIVAGPLRASRAAVTAYEATIGTAAEQGLGYAASLLNSSLTEEKNTTRRLALMAMEISEEQ